MAPKQKSPAPSFHVGSEVEISSVLPLYAGAWFEAHVVAVHNRDGLYTVALDNFVDDDDHSSLHRVQADEAHIRPRPPPSSLSVVLFHPDQPIEVLKNDIWWSGTVSSVIEGEDRETSYTVRLGTGEERVSGPEQLRHRIEWICGEWVELAPQETEYIKGSLVEVSSDDEGYKGAKYTATIVECLANNKFLVEYLHLLKDDKTELLKEKVDSWHIRPILPKAQTYENFKLFDVVDARYNDGWWVGEISEVLDGRRYIVYFKTTGEEIEFGHKQLRRYHEWVNGNWLCVSQLKVVTVSARSVLQEVCVVLTGYLTYETIYLF